MRLDLKRGAMSVAGTCVVGAGVGLLQFAQFGVDPFTCVVMGLDQWIPLDYGTVYLLVNAVLLLYALLEDRGYIGLGTLANLLLIGYIAAFVRDWASAWLPAALLWRAAVFCGGMAVLCFGSSIYFTADMGVSAYDAVALILAYRRGLWQFRYLRICTDLVCLGSGAAFFLLGGGRPAGLSALVGVGTVIAALCQGPAIAFFNPYVARWFHAEQWNTMKTVKKEDCK